MQNVHPTTLGDAYWADPEDIAYRFSYKDGESFFLGRSLTNFDQIVGTNKKGADDKHVGLFGKTRGSKGRSFIIPNLLSYEGSVVSVDPKGENASVCAARRANGDDFCDGVGQDTYVLDPNRRARNVPEELYASCNLLDYIDPNDPDLFGKCAMLVRGLTLEPKGGESADWSDEGVSWTTLVMAHLLTTSDYRKSEKNLWLVQKLIIVGYMDAIDEMEKAARAQLAEYKRQFELWEQEGESADSMPERPEFGPKPNGIELMLKRMQDNRALDGQIALQAKGYAELRKDNSRQWAGIHRHSIRELEFLNNLNIKDSVFGSRGTLTRALDVRTLKSTPNGVSIFICLKGKAGDPAIRWQRALLTLICDAMQEEQGVPENGKPLLMCIDEFNDLKRMDDVVEILNQGA
ncbi:MAG: type IV secretory system conjugative DNA transfer family protein, partial [Pseudomonadota bacterium]